MAGATTSFLLLISSDALVTNMSGRPVEDPKFGGHGIPSSLSWVFDSSRPETGTHTIPHN